MLTRLEPPGAELAASVGEAEYARLLGLPRVGTLEGEPAQRARGARSWYAANGRPWVAARRVAIARLEADGVVLEGGGVLRGPVVADRLLSGEAHALLALAVSAGRQLDEESRRLWAQEKPDEAFFLDRFGAAVAEHLVFWASLQLCRRAEPGGETVLAHLSPGCGGWDFEEQTRLMSLITGSGERRIGPIEMLASGMLTPKNSLLAVRGITRHLVAPTPADGCRSCDLSPCVFRRAPFQGAA